jgi:hypothetical protein
MIDPQLEHRPPVVTARTLRQFAGMWLLFVGGFACWQWLGRDRATLAAVAGALAVVVGVAGLARPQAVRPIFSGMMLLALPIGAVVSRVLLAILYYGLITPLGLLFRLLGRDALRRRRRRAPETWWVPKPMPTDVRSYFRQF